MSKKKSRKNTNNKKKKAGVLQGHKRQGKKFITPLNQLPGGLKYIRWANDMFPELIWMGCVLEYSGIRDGVNQCLALARLANDHLNESKGFHFSKVSAYYQLNEEQKQAIIQQLKDDNLYTKLSSSLLPLNVLYPNSPLSFLTQNRKEEPGEDLLKQMKNIVGKCFPRAEQPAMIIQANAICIAICAHKFGFTSNVQPPNLDLIITNFEEPEGQRESSSIRALVLSLFNFDDSDVSKEWGNYFWNRGLELEACDCNGDANVK